MEDSHDIRELLQELMPYLTITGAPKASGQRLVYYVEVQHGEPSPPAGSAVLKVSKGASPREIAYLQRELDVLEQLNSKYFPRSYLNDTYSIDPRTDEPLSDRLFVTLEERLDGATLADSRTAFTDYGSILRLMIDLVAAATTLWDMRPSRVHRDIKPDNIIIRPDGGISLIDLGIMREEGAVGLTATAAPFGPCTPAYCSPEQARNDKRNITFKSDMFSIGIIGYELLSGHSPFNENNSQDIQEIFDRLENAPPPSLAANHGVPQDISDLIDNMLQYHPYQRPRSPKGLIDSLNALSEICQ